MPFSYQERDALLTNGSPTFDLLIIGGGITGAGIAHDAVSRGFRVALVEKDDFASGTSSRSSNLIHGGLRYLEQLDFKLVFESVQERAILTKLAPHLVRPVPFLFPIYKGDRNGLFKMRLGLTLYEMLAFYKIYKRHRVYRTAAVQGMEPGLNDTNLKGAVTYYDCMTNDARLTLETLVAAHQRGAVIGNYIRVTDLSRRDNAGLHTATIADSFSGQRFTLQARAVVNAGGPWSDSVRQLLADGRRAKIRPTKGVHLVVPRFRLPVNHAVVMSSAEDKRIIFAIPWPNATIIGTTDTDYEADIDDIIADGADIDYLLRITNQFFPESKLCKADIIATWAGVRPLIDEGDDANASAVSREHEIVVDDDGLVSILGGKLTTYRHMAGEVVDVVVDELEKAGITLELTKSSTRDTPLPGNENFEFTENRERWIAALADELPHLEHAIPYLVDQYGTRHTEVIALIRAHPSLGRPLLDGHPFLWAELEYAIAQEMVLTPADFFRRRTRICLTTRTQGAEITDKVAQRIAERRGLGANAATELAAHYTTYLNDRRFYYT